MKKTIIMFLFATLILGSCNNTNNNQPNDNPSQNANNSENVVDNKNNKNAIEFDAEVWKSKDYAARYNMIESLFKQNNNFDFSYTLQNLTDLLGEPDQIYDIVLETYPSQFGGYEYYYWVDSRTYSGRREWILFTITPLKKVGGYSIDAYGYNDDFGDDVSNILKIIN